MAQIRIGRVTLNAPAVAILILVAIFLLNGQWAILWLLAIPVAGTVFSTAVIVLMDYRRRQPGEAFLDWYGRVLSRNSQSADETFELKYQTTFLDCGHRVQVASSAPTIIGQKVWCPGHRRFGPALLSTVAERPANFRELRTVLDAELAQPANTP